MLALRRAVLATFNDLAVAVGSKSNTAKTIFPKENMSDLGTLPATPVDNFGGNVWILFSILLLLMGGHGHRRLGI